MADGEWAGAGWDRNKSARKDIEKTGAVQKLRPSDLVALHSGMLPDFAARSSVLT